MIDTSFEFTGLPSDNAGLSSLTHPAYGDPEWAADAAWGSLTNEYSLRATFTDIDEIDAERPL